MFDSSFNRSRDYFVALQILRIIDEWLHEARSTIQDMLKSLMINEGYFSTTIRYVNDHAATVQNRVRDKKEEINSLRDGVGSHQAIQLSYQLIPFT
jgi:hypothetical protein